MDAQSGVLKLTGGGTSTGSFSAGTGATLRFGGGTHNLNGGSSFTGDGTVDLNTGTINVNGPCTANGTALGLSLATLTGTGTLTVNGTMNWSGGTMSGSGSTDVSTGGTLNISGTSATKTLDTRTINNAGTVAVTTTPQINFYNATINNQAGATFDLQSDTTLTNIYGTNTFTNAGTLRKSAGTGMTAMAIVVNNTGTVDAQSGVLKLTGGGTSTGVFSADTEGTLRFGGGTHTLNGGTSFTGAGIVDFNTGTINVNGSCTANGAALNLSLATLTGTGTMTVNGAMNWSGGTMSGSGSTDISAGGTLDISGTSYTKTLDTRTINNAGTVAVTTTPQINFYNATINNQAGATFDLQSDTTLTNIYGTNTFNNTGTVRKSAGTGNTTMAIVVNNTGTVDALTGTLLFSNNFTNSPTGILQGTGTLSFTGTTFTNTGSINPATAGTAGKLNISGTLRQTSTVNVDIGGTTRRDSARPARRERRGDPGGNAQCEPDQRLQSQCGRQFHHHDLWVEDGDI